MIPICDLFVRAYARDFPWLKYCLQSIDKYACGYNRVIICLPEGQEYKTYHEVVHSPIYKNDYIGQQVDKLKAYKHSDAEFIQFMDSDTLFIENVTPKDFMRDGKPMILKTRYEDVGDAICWKKPTEEALHITLTHELMRRNGGLFLKQTLKDLDLYMELLHGMPMADYILSKDSFSEFNLLGAYAEKFESDKYTFIDTKDEIPKSLVRQFWSHDKLSNCIGEINSILYPDFKKELLGLPQDAEITQEIADGRNVTFHLTMLGYDRLQNIEGMIERTKDVDGDLIETGVWRGGACMLMKHTLAKMKSDKKVYVCDSFEGVPAPDVKYPHDNGDTHHLVPFISVSEEEVKANFEKYGLLDESVIFIKGWFKDTLDKIDAKFSIIRLDGDLYESTMDALEALYPKLSPQGICIIDDYHLVAGCAHAVNDFREKYNITNEMTRIGWTGIWFQKN